MIIASIGVPPRNRDWCARVLSQIVPSGFAGDAAGAAGCFTFPPSVTPPDFAGPPPRVVAGFGPPRVAPSVDPFLGAPPSVDIFKLELKMLNVYDTALVASLRDSGGA